MDNNQKPNEEEMRDRLAAARLAMSSTEEKAEWQTREDYLRSRKKDAAQAMISAEQKNRLEEEARAREELIQKQKKLEILEQTRRLAEEKRKKDLAEEQKKNDEIAEAKRQEQIERITESKAGIKNIIRQNLSGPQTIRTLRDDIAETVKKDQVTASKIIIQERALRQEANQQKELNKKKKRANLILAISSFFIIFGLAAFALVWWQKKEEDSKKIGVAKKSVIFSDHQIKLDTTNLTKETLRAAQKEAFDSLTADSNGKDITDLYFSKITNEIVKEKVISQEIILGANEYLATSTEITDNFSRFVENDFMVGFLLNQNVSPFFIFKTNNYKHLADTMILSGKPVMVELFGLFWNEDKINLARGSVFQDITLKNYDLRVLRDEGDNPVAGYVFLDDKTLLIFETESDFQKLLDAYLISQTSSS